MIISQPKELIAAFVNDRQGISTYDGWGFYTAIGLVKDDKLVAGVIYNQFEACNICTHIAAIEGKRWLTKAYLKAIFEYPFVQLRANRITGPVRSKNVSAARFVENLGFRLEGNCPKFFPDDDLLVYGMLREECRFLRSQHGQEISQSTAAS